jgi:DNA polymerase III subunit beta
MRATVLQEDLSKALSISSRFASPKAQLPILGNVLLVCGKSKLRVHATNLETSISLAIGAKVERDGELTVPARVISEIVSNLPKGQVQLQTQKEKLLLSSGAYTSEISGIDSSDFPKVPSDMPAGSVVIFSDVFVSGLASVLPSVSVDETRPVLTGMLLVFKGSNLTFVATDGFRLSKKTLSIGKAELEAECILPRNTLSELVRIAGSVDKLNIAFPKGESLAIFGFGNTVLSSRIIQGKFPDFEKIIPKTSNITLDVDKEELTRAIKISGVFARDSANVITFDIKKNSLAISSQSKQSGKQKIEMDTKTDGKVDGGVSIGFNYKFIEDFLNIAASENVIMKFTNADSPGVFLNAKDKDFLHIIMPVKL